MRYLGGKSRLAKRIVEAIGVKPGDVFLDPFCGGLSVSAAAAKAGADVHASDLCAPLITLYRAVQDGWEPPESVTEEEHRAARDLPDDDPLKAFIGFGCSFGAMWFRTYARAPGRNYAAEAKRSLTRTVTSDMRFGCQSFFDIPIRPDVVLYLDPPYQGTTGYTATGPFDHDRFIERVKEWAEVTPVYVSEFDFPLGEVVWEKQRPVTVGQANKQSAIDRLYRVEKENNMAQRRSFRENRAAEVRKRAGIEDPPEAVEPDETEEEQEVEEAPPGRKKVRKKRTARAAAPPPEPDLEAEPTPVESAPTAITLRVAIDQLKALLKSGEVISVTGGR